MEIKKGDKFLCIKSVYMDPGGEMAYRQGEVYCSDEDGCITDLQGTVYHEWRAVSKFREYFVPREEKPLFDEYGNLLKVGDLVVVKVADNVILRGEVTKLNPEEFPAVTVEVEWPNKNNQTGQVETTHHYSLRDGKVCMSEVVKI